MPRSKLLDPRSANRCAHFCNLGIDQFLQILGRALVTRGYVRDDFLEPVVHPRRVEGRRQRRIEPADDRLGRALWEEQAEPRPCSAVLGRFGISGERLGCRMAMPLTVLPSSKGLPVGLSVQM